MLRTVRDSPHSRTSTKLDYHILSVPRIYQTLLKKICKWSKNKLHMSSPDPWTPSAQKVESRKYSTSLGCRSTVVGTVPHTSIFLGSAAPIAELRSLDVTRLAIVPPPEHLESSPLPDSNSCGESDGMLQPWTTLAGHRPRMSFTRTLRTELGTSLVNFVLSI